MNRPPMKRADFPLGRDGGSDGWVRTYGLRGNGPEAWAGRTRAERIEIGRLDYHQVYT